MKTLMIVVGLLLSIHSFGADEGDITVKIEALTNISGNGAMEACGTAIHKSGIRPLMITIKHDESFYTTLTAPNNKWCVVLKRWNFNGKVEVSGTTLNEPAHQNFRNINAEALNN